MRDKDIKNHAYCYCQLNEVDTGENLLLTCGKFSIKAGIVKRTPPTNKSSHVKRVKIWSNALAFAEQIETPVAALRDWEQGRFVPLVEYCACFWLIIGIQNCHVSFGISRIAWLSQSILTPESCTFGVFCSSHRTAPLSGYANGFSVPADYLVR